MVNMNLTDNVNLITDIKKELIEKGIISYNNIFNFFQSFRPEQFIIHDIKQMGTDIIIKIQLKYYNQYTIPDLIRIMINNIITTNGIYTSEELRNVLFDNNQSIISGLYFTEKYPENIYIIRL